jgi:hypothetical protein
MYIFFIVENFNDVLDNTYFALYNNFNAFKIAIDVKIIERLTKISIGNDSFVNAFFLLNHIKFY